MHASINYTKFVINSVAYTTIATVLTSTHTVQAASAPGESPLSVSYPVQPSQEKLLKQNYTITNIPLQITLDVVTAVEKNQLGTSQKGQPLKIGFGRTMPQAYKNDLKSLLSWEILPNGDKVATFSVRSPDASGVRLGLYLQQFPDTAELRFFNPTQLSQTFGPFLAETVRSRMPFWSPTIAGDSIGVEIYVPVNVTSEFPIKIANVQHLVYSPLNPNSKNLAQIGNSDNCEIDVKCATTNPDDLSAAVAKIIFTKPEGSYLCTGTLLNDKDTTTNIPYFMTAHHCISTPSVADTVESYWFFEKSACDGTPPITTTQFSNGADLLATGADTDFTLLKLKDNEIGNLSGISFAGWSSVDPIGKTVIGIHHPMGDVKKWSEGHADYHTSWPPNEATDHIQVTWSQGVTEQGSSGSGLFAVTGEENNQQLFIGNLHGGWSFCNKPQQPDLYGRFDLTYPLVRQWLDATETNNQFYLESPQSGSYESGIGLIRGWACQANTVEFQIDDGVMQNIPYGSNRGDTETVCGDKNNGFGFTFNWNSLINGTHTIKLFIDGTEVATANFTTTNLGVDFLKGASGECEVSDFPEFGDTIKLKWSEPHQNFVIVPY